MIPGRPVTRPAYRAAIVGCSWIATDPATSSIDPALRDPMPPSHAAAYAAMPEIDLVAVCDLSAEALARFTAAWGGRWPRLRTYTDYRRLLAEERPDIVSVCTPDDRHAPVVVAAAEAGARGILCEKPLATNLADAECMIAAVAAHGVAFSVDVTRRWSPDYQQARALVRQGRIGDLRLIVATRGGPMAWLYRAGGHLFDLTGFFADAEPLWLTGDLDEGYENHVAWRAGVPRDPEAEPGGDAYVRFANGVRASIHCSRRLPNGYQVELFGSRGRLRVDDRSAELWTQTVDGGPLVMEPLPHPSYQASGILAALIELTRLIETGEEGVSTAQDAIRALKLILATVESNRRGGARVKIEEING